MALSALKAQSLTLGPGLRTTYPFVDNPSPGLIAGINFSVKYFYSSRPWTVGLNISSGGKRLNEVDKYQLHQIGIEVTRFFGNEKKGVYLAAEIGPLLNYRDDSSIPLATFYLNISPKLGKIIPLSHNAWLDINAGIGYGINPQGTIFYLPFSVGLLYDPLKMRNSRKKHSS